MDPIALPQPSTFDSTANTWEWKLNGEDVEEGCGCFVTKGQTVRASVLSVEFRDPLEESRNVDLHRARSESVCSLRGDEVKSKFKAAMVVKASIKETGLGPLEWWEEAEDEE